VKSCSWEGNHIALAMHHKTSVVYPPTGSRPKTGRWAMRLHLHSLWSMVHFAFTASLVSASWWVSLSIPNPCSFQFSQFQYICFYRVAYVADASAYWPLSVFKTYESHTALYMTHCFLSIHFWLWLANCLCKSRDKRNLRLESVLWLVVIVVSQTTIGRWID